ncbi:MAG: leucine-rich repeat domain-containing protein [Ruminococcus sp.]|uniref:leucine-rich repeat domain-containing protein n=1 Tax=Ruminococcus sp. TaxID=41978 RepID=UPI00399102B3
MFSFIILLFFSLVYFFSITPIPNSVTSIEYEVFSDCTSLTSITIPDGVTSIGNSAFRCCRNLTALTLPNSVTNIEEYAFLYCESLTDITISNCVTRIGREAFSNCKSIKIAVSDKRHESTNRQRQSGADSGASGKDRLCYQEEH